MRGLRTQPPVGYRFAIGDLLRAVADSASGADASERLAAGLSRHFGGQRVFAVTSGKASLTLILRALHAMTGRRKVIVPAYTCYSVPSAVVKAGLDVVPCDVAPGTFDYDYSRLQPLLGQDVLCALSVHLFGIPSDPVRLKALCEPRGIFVVEDAAQAMGGMRDGVALGTIGDIGFFSLGRGKNVTCGSGGIILTRSGDIASELEHGFAGVPPSGTAADLKTIVTLAALSVFISPRLYWLPAGLPFLRLGETVFHDDFPVRRLSAFQASLLSRWTERLAALDAVRCGHARFYRAHLDGVQIPSTDLPYLRFPVLLPSSEERERILFREHGKKLGMSVMYPTTVAGIRQLQGRLPEYVFPEAERIVSTLVTLPTHPLLSEAERVRICSLVNHAAEQPLTLRRTRIAS